MIAVSVAHSSALVVTDAVLYKCKSSVAIVTRRLLENISLTLARERTDSGTVERLALAVPVRQKL
jgi:hypothetical protein